MIMRLYHLERWLFLHKLNVFAKIIKAIIRITFSAVIPPSAKIGKGSFITYHGLGVVIHKDAVIGENCIIRQNVTIAGNDFGVPQIGNNVEINAGAVLVGNISIGDNVRIGANAFVNKDIPDNCVAAGVPVRIIKSINPDDFVIKI